MNLYTMLRNELVLAASFTRPKYAFVYEIVLVTIVYTVSYCWLLQMPSLIINIALLICLAFAVVQAGFIAHEASHHNLSDVAKSNNRLGQIFLTLLTGVSYSWFCHIHKRHHANPEDPSEPRTYGGTQSLALHLNGALPKNIHASLLWVIAILRAFTMHVDGLHYLYSQTKTTRVDQLLMCLHFVIWFILPIGYIGLAATLFNYVLLNVFTGMYIGPLLLLSHTNHPANLQTKNNAENHRMQHNLLTTRNINNAKFSEFILKGTGAHIEHHLFPSIPYANLRQARLITQHFCQRHDLNYNDSTLVTALNQIGQKSF